MIRLLRGVHVLSLWLLLAAAIVPTFVSAQPAAPTPTPPAPLAGEQQQRYDTMINQLRCLVCQNETIADSSAPLALDLRDQVHRQIADGRSDDEIRDYLTHRYGDFVLYKPRLAARTLALWIGPFALLAIALIAAVLFMRRSSARQPATPGVADAERIRRLLQEQEGSD